MDPSVEARQPQTTLAGQYKRALDGFSSEFASVMEWVARAPEGGVMVHCMGGKDRTGLISALLLSLVGVDNNVIAADYAMSRERLWSIDREWLDNGPGDREQRERDLDRRLARREVMLEVLDHLERAYGGAQPYLERAGVSRTDLQGLSVRLLEHAKARPRDAIPPEDPSP